MGVIPGIGIEFYKLTTKLNNTKDIIKEKETTANFDDFIGLGYNSKNSLEDFIIALLQPLEAKQEPLILTLQIHTYKYL